MSARPASIGAPVGHAGRADAFAGAAAEAGIEMGFDTRRHRNALFGERLHQRDAAARRVGLVARVAVARTVQQAEAALDAEIGAGQRKRSGIESGHRSGKP
ncbi:MAG: hypothetical protein NVS9B10_30310 [Nevskia sp.]